MCNSPVLTAVSTTETQMNTILAQLKGITIGRTKVINNKAVTRWTADKWEVGTWGRKTQSIDEASQCLK